ncbi:MAG: hypothetical protein IT372_37030, partial [Polyangiaceae bacterium]|nr:hypothetical protein [Polyangiaceae bacterium]
MRRAPIRASAALAMLAPLLTLAACADAPPPALGPSAPAAAPPAAVPEPFHFPEAAAAAKKERGAPIQLTASDGTGLALVALSGRAVVEDPLAFTELKLVFKNPEDRVLEGTFSITLPSGASVSRFAMRIGERWQEGEVVERQEARRAYEDFLHRKQDPALLEQSAGNEFSARVFPIPARGTKEIVISYAQEIGPGAPFAIPLRGLPRIGEIDLAVRQAGAAAVARELHARDATPDADFVLDRGKLPGGDGLRSGDLVLARVRPLADASPDPLSSAVILVDTSASRALDLEAEIRLVAALAKRVAQAGGAGAPLAVACYDQTVAPIYDGPAGSFGEPDLARIRARQALGASDLAGALRWAGERAKGGQHRRVVLLTDGVATAGEVASDRLRAAAAALRPGGIERLDAVGLGGIRDDDALRAMVTAGLPRDGVVADGLRGEAEVERRLSAATRSGVEVKIDGARWLWPQTLNGVQPGDEVLVYAEVPAAMPVRVTVGGKTSSPALRSAERPLLERAWAQAKIDSLLFFQGAGAPPDSIRREIIDLSITHRVVSPYTALLVLETEHDYARFGIARRGLSDILTVEGGRVAVMKRSLPASKGWDVAAPQAPPRSRPKAEPAAGDPSSARGGLWGDSISESFGAGGLGLSGSGEGGGGRSEDIGLGDVGTIGHGAGLPPAASAAPAAGAPDRAPRGAPSAPSP